MRQIGKQIKKREREKEKKLNEGCLVCAWKRKDLLKRMKMMRKNAGERGDG